jgi:hypothetical protein
MVVACFANHLYPRFFMDLSETRGGKGYEIAHLRSLAKKGPVQRFNRAFNLTHALSRT